MPSTTIVVACAVALTLLVVAVLIARSRSKAAAEAPPRLEPPREHAEPALNELPQEAPPPPSLGPSSHAQPPMPSARVERVEAPTFSPPVEPPPQKVKTPAIAFPTPQAPVEKPSDAPLLDGRANSYEESVGQIAEPEPTPTAPMSPPEVARASARPPLRSYSNITDDSVEETPSEPHVAETSEPATALADVTPSESKLPALPKPPPPPPRRISEPKLGAVKPTSEPKVAPAKPLSDPKLTPAKPLLTSEPKVAAAKPLSEPKFAAAKPALPTSEPKVPAAKPLSEPKVPSARPEPKVSEPKVPATKPLDEHDFSALNEAPAAKPQAATPAAAARFVPPSNPATAELEKNDPRHAAARRLARVSVSEIKLYHEDEVRAGREANDLWKRLSQDISLARQTFDARVVPEVRERFDYLLDEVIRQLAEGDPKKLGPEAPTLKGADSEPSSDHATVPPPASPDAALAAIDTEAPTKTHKALDPVGVPPAVETPAPAAPPPPAAEPSKPTGLAARGIPSNPETAELEKNDPRHAAARRLARLSVSEIKLYHEDEVKAGREAKDLWTRLKADIGLATQTYEKRVDKEVRDRFDYLYDEILRQLAEGDVAKLGPDAPKGKKASAAEPAAVAAPEPASIVEQPVAPPAAPPPEPVAVAKAAPAPAPAPTNPAASAAARYAPPSNPATAELEKADPRHAAARRLARLSVSEIKLYHEDEVKAGREAKDLWRRLTTDIGLATQTYEKRVDKEVRDRFDYLYDEILRQLAEGDVAKLGPEAPKRNTAM